MRTVKSILGVRIFTLWTSGSFARSRLGVLLGVDEYLYDVSKGTTGTTGKVL